MKNPVVISVFVFALATSLPLIESATYGPYTLTTQAYPNQYVGVMDFLYTLLVEDTANFKVMIHSPGLNGEANTVSFESVNSPGQYIATTYLMGMLSVVASPDNNAASFYAHKDKWLPGTTAYESVSNPGDYFQMSNFGNLGFGGPDFITISLSSVVPGTEALASWKLNYLGSYCSLPSGISDAVFSPSQDSYENGAEVTLSCPSTHSARGTTTKITCSAGSFSPATIDFSCFKKPDSGKGGKACQKTYKTSGYLVRSSPKLSYADAAKFCADGGATLPYKGVKTAADREAIINMLGMDNTYFWLGMTKVGGAYQWADGSSVDVAQAGFAANGAVIADGDCVVNWKGDGSKYDQLNDVDCNNQLKDMAKVLRKNHGFEKAISKIVCEFECL